VLKTWSTGFDAFRFIGDNIGLLLAKTGEHLELSGAALGIALVLALPLGLWPGHRHQGLFFATSVSTIGRALPSVALIAFGLTIFGFGWSRSRRSASTRACSGSRAGSLPARGA
jgi:osmoprotectant transport system permease protein